MSLINEQPINYWDFVMRYLPDYSSRDDVLKSDIFTRYLTGEPVLEDDIDFFRFKSRSIEDIIKEYTANEKSLF